MKTQDQIFLEEGNQWFARNVSHLGRSSHNDHILPYLESSNIIPKKVLDIGCSNGIRLHYIRELFNCQCFGIEPSKQAVENGKDTYPELNLQLGFSHDLKIYQDNSFDLVIISYVLHWVDRKHLLATVSEVDRVLEDHGYLIIQDFNPITAYRAPYHHLPNDNVFTYKQPYWDIFTASNMYNLISFKEFLHEPSDIVDNKNLCACAVLQKRLNENYPVR